MRESVARNWPTFDAPLLREIAAAFLRRRKAIAYQASLSCERQFSEAAARTAERLNLEAGGLRLSAWADTTMWLGVCVRGPGRGAGWAFKDTFHGDIGDVSAKALVGMVEATLALPFGADAAEVRARLRGLWARIHPYGG
jgi:hypothetical protein